MEKQEAKTIYQEIEEAKKLRKAGKGFADIRSQLEEKAYEEEDIKKIIREVDNYEHQQNSRQKEKEKTFEQVIIGGLIALASTFFVIYLYRKEFLDQKLYLLAFAGIFLGYFWSRIAWRKYKSFDDE